VTLRVQRRLCATCIYKPDSPLDLARLESEVKDRYGFVSHRICHHSEDVCCRGFWEAHKDEFPAGQIAQRLGLVEYVDVDTLGSNLKVTK
jgi:hypothetical protein